MSNPLMIDLRRPSFLFRGWGTSLCWWANRAGGWPAGALDRLIGLLTDPARGLGMNIFRYNIGGGERPEHHHMRPFGDVPGFKAAPDAPYDFEADARQRLVLQKLISASADPPILEAFSNSAPWWMTLSGCAAGAVDGGPNLPETSEKAFADYLSDVVLAYRDRHKIEFESLEPLNEPDGNWWKQGNHQEGMHVPIDQQARLIRLCRAALDRRGLGKTMISATDANHIDRGLTAFRAFDAETMAAMGRINIHTYGGDQRRELREFTAAQHKPMWMSETGPMDFKGAEHEQLMRLASRVAADLNGLQPEAWCTWQIIDIGPWGVVHAPPEAEDFTVAGAFHMFAPFMRRIRPGDRVVPLEAENVVAAISAQRGEATIVIVNPESEARNFEARLIGVAESSESVFAIRNESSGDLITVEPMRLQGDRLVCEAPALSVTAVSFRL